ncbi:MAG: hypothetical protein AAF517_08580 [Planctomycetota bacterium]
MSTKPKRRRWPWLVVVALVVTSLAIGGILWFGDAPPPTIPIPRLSEKRAKSTLDRRGLGSKEVSKLFDEWIGDGQKPTEWLRDWARKTKVHPRSVSLFDIPRIDRERYARDGEPLLRHIASIEEHCSGVFPSIGQCGDVVLLHLISGEERRRVGDLEGFRSHLLQLLALYRAAPDHCEDLGDLAQAPFLLQPAQTYVQSVARLLNREEVHALLELWGPFIVRQADIRRLRKPEYEDLARTVGGWTEGGASIEECLGEIDLVVEVPTWKESLLFKPNATLRDLEKLIGSVGESFPNEFSRLDWKQPTVGQWTWNGAGKAFVHHVELSMSFPIDWLTLEHERWFQNRLLLLIRQFELKYERLPRALSELNDPFVSFDNYRYDVERRTVTAVRMLEYAKQQTSESAGAFFEALSEVEF